MLYISEHSNLDELNDEFGGQFALAGRMPGTANIIVTIIAAIIMTPATMNKIIH